MRAVVFFLGVLAIDVLCLHWGIKSPLVGLEQHIAWIWAGLFMLDLIEVSNK